MSGMLPRLRALRPRPHQQRVEGIDRVKGIKPENASVNSDMSRADDRMELGDIEDVGREIVRDKSAKNTESTKAYADHLKREQKQKDTQMQDSEVNKCSMCSYVALSARDIETHQRVHHLKRRYFRCAKCSYVTHVRARYTKHVKYHSMPMIKCDTCDFRTPYKWNLDRHTRNHGGGGAFQCRACNFTADIRQSLTVHETNHHEPPVGQVNRKTNTPFERKPRNSPKRYNQVGASDFLETTIIQGKSLGSTELYISSNIDQAMMVNDQKNSIASAECIALKCEEKGCQFITAWDSEMQRHLAECHAPGISCKSRRPLPMLIPLSSQTPKSNNSAATSTTLLKVPRVRVRPELAQIARDTELAKMYGTKEALNLKRDGNGAASSFERKNASFFDKLKEKLTTSATINNGMQEVAVTTVNDLKCWCTFKASTAEELARHKQTHHTALSVSVGTLRCPQCRRRCKSTADLQVHMQCCHSNDKNAPSDTATDRTISDADFHTAYHGEYTFSAQEDWDMNAGAHNSSGSSVEGASTYPSVRRVFKCPHCPFWASTASRFHVHIVGHLNRKPFECSLCAYRSNWRWDITKHIKLKAAKDPLHMTARVLMTDETGRRNYSKYNKYLAQIEQQAWNEQNMEEGDRSEGNSGEPPTKLLIVDNKEYSQTASVSLLTSNESNNNESNPSTSLRPPPPLKAAVRSRGGQSLLKNNPTFNNNTAPSTSTDENKRTLWKCKRCNYRDSDKETVLLHVKLHYEGLEQSLNESKNVFTCEECPFSTTDAALLATHKMHHRPNLEAIFKCYLCPYYVSTKTELLEHARLHGEELAVVHQQSAVDHHHSSPLKRKHSQISNSNNVYDDSKDDESSERKNAGSSSTSSRSGGAPPPLLLDTRSLPEPPLVWVSRPDGTLAKMLKCRHCPYVTSRRAEAMDHESMHVEPASRAGSYLTCPDCSFACTRREIMTGHSDMHSGSLGTVHCLVDGGRSDSQQLNDLATLLGLTRAPALGPEPDLRDSRLVHCCAKCPARFLCEKELRIHLRYHSTELAYSCQWCSYAARQPAHLLAHQKAHSSEYQERTKYLLSLYGHSQKYPPPSTACIETNERESAWIVVEVANGSTATLRNFDDNFPNEPSRIGNQVFTCAKCPARYFKLDALEYHMTLHGSNNRFKCAECDYSSKTAQNLVKHQVVHRRHNEAREAASSPPPQSQPQQSRLQSQQPDPQFGVYMRGNPNFVYPGYLRNGRLKEKRYKCHKCPSAFEKREQYRIHLTLHGAKQRYRCDTCDYSVKYYANYIQHLKKHRANAEAQASRRQFEEETISIENDANSDFAVASMTSVSRSRKTLRYSASSSRSSTANSSTTAMTAMNCANTQLSNYDRQASMLVQKKVGMLASLPSCESEVEALRCQSCPFSTSDKETLDSHKRRHGIERMTPSCPHCDYVPRKDENVADHVRLHFTRLYKPESYLIIELLTLTMRRFSPDGKEEKQELLFKECADGRFVPDAEMNSVGDSSATTTAEKVLIDPSTGETKHHVIV